MVTLRRPALPVVFGCTDAKAFMAFDLSTAWACAFCDVIWSATFAMDVPNTISRAARIMMLRIRLHLHHPVPREPYANLLTAGASMTVPASAKTAFSEIRVREALILTFRAA